MSLFHPYKTQEKSAIPFSQGQSLNPYSPHYKMTFAFSPIFCPTESSVFVALDLLMGSTYHMRLCRVYPVVSFGVFEMVRWLTILRQRCMFPRLNKGILFKPICLPFWLQPFRDNLAVCSITQFNRQLSLCSSNHLFSLLPLTA